MSKLLVALLTLCLGCAEGLTTKERLVSEHLLKAYPDFLKEISGDQLIWKDGTKMPLLYGKTTDYISLLNHPSLLDQLSDLSSSCQAITIPKQNIDVGRIRYEPFFFKMYGASAGQVKANLVPVHWFGQTVMISKINGVADSLQKIAKEIARQPQLLPYATPSAGTFLWRKIAGTPRISVHAFGAAIDLNTKFSDYWLWAGYKEGQAGIRYKNQMPLALVKIFEKHGWIWGGRWYHYDTMHFEYRPELTQPAQCQ